VTVNLDGEVVGSAYASFYPGNAGRPQRLGLQFYAGNALLAPDADLTRVMTARVMDTCTGTDQDFTFNSLKIDVISAS
jgi:hypothetical protein